MKKKLLALIERHNAVVDALSGCDLPVPEGKVFRAMEVWYKLFQRRGRWWAYHSVGVDV